MSAVGIRPKLLAVWALLSVLVGAIVVLERTDVFEPEPPPKTGSFPMFRFGEPDLGAVNVIHEGRFAALRKPAAFRCFASASPTSGR
ncbi:MAG: hypothetical protein ACYSTY_06755 [Planctomycetota bacterium]